MNIGHEHARPGALPDRRRLPDSGERPRLRWLRGLMRRPFALSWRGGRPRLVWVERRQRPVPDDAVAGLRADLQAELLSQDNAAMALRELVLVDEQLGRAGWAGLAALPPQVIARAQMQADMLAASTGSVPLAALAARLRDLQSTGGAVDVGARPQLRPVLDEDAVEVSELGEDAYAQAEEAWASSRPAELAPPTTLPPPKDSGLSP